MKQRDAFLLGEGIAWFKRNKKRIQKDNDPVIHAIKKYKILPTSVLEVGCANGWRLLQLKEEFGCRVDGVDPGTYAPNFWNGTADELNLYWTKNTFDVVVYGWCLYLCDPEDYFKIADQGDRVLRDGGFLIIYDFCTEAPYRVPYKHKEGLFSYHYDFSKLWLAHPAYSLYGRTVQDETCVTILKKNMKTAFPEEK